MALTLEQCEERMPFINWREPIVMRNTDSTMIHYGCRVCIASDGIKGADVDGLPLSIDAWREHFAAEHGEPRA